jgi:hypothetical protein
MEPTQPGNPVAFVVPIYRLQLGDIPRNVNILIFHFHQGLDENVKKLAYL